MTDALAVDNPTMVRSSQHHPEVRLIKRPDFAAFRTRASTFVVAGLGAGAAAVASFSTALYDAAMPDELPIVAAGEPVDTGRWTVSLIGAKFGKASGASAEKPEQLQVELEMTNRSAETSNGYMRLLTLANAPADLKSPNFILLRDNATLFGLHPDMPERVTAVWDWPQGSVPPKSVEISIASQIHKRRDNLYGAPGWFDRPPVAKVILPVKAEASP